MLRLAIVALVGWYGVQILVGILFIALGAHEGRRYRRAIRQIERGSVPPADTKRSDARPASLLGRASEPPRVPGY